MDFRFGKRLFPGIKVQDLMFINEGMRGKGLNVVIFLKMKGRSESLNEGLDFDELRLVFSHGDRRG